MSLALNRDEINKALCFSLCQPTQGVPVHRTVSFAKPEWFTKDIEYDPDTANALLDELGLKKGADGFRLRPDGKPLVIHLIYAIQWGDPALHELAKEYWEAVGVKVELKEISTEAYRAMAANNDHDIQVTNSGTEVEAPLYSNPFRLFPPFGDAALEPLFGAPWVEWHNTNGEQGTEPPDDIKPLWDLTDKWKSSLPGSEDYIKLGQQLVQVQMDRGMIIGTITTTPAVTIVSRRLGNVPQLKINAFEYYRTYPYRTDQWYFKE
jgi:peptide/nickel transport system substrate-binding protein